MPDIDFALLPESFGSLSVENVQANRRLLRDLWSSAEPLLDIDRGALSSLVLTPAATLFEVGRETFRTARKSSSFTALLADSSEVAEAMLDELAKSYRVSRRTGTASSGRIRLFFREDLFILVGLSTTFQANGIEFRVRNVETLQPSEATPSTLPNYQNLRAIQDGSGLFYADIEVFAQSNGVAANLTHGTELELANSSLSYFVRAVALETFTGGEDDETKESLIQRMVLGISAKVLSSRVNMRAALLEKFPEIRDSSIIGAGDSEMTRDKHTIFPGSTGGYADWYVGTTRQLLTTSCVLENPILLETRIDGTCVYTATLDDTNISCLYHVTNIQEADTAVFCEILEQHRSVRDSAPYEVSNTPHIVTEEEGAFTAYQTTTVTFTTPSPVAKILIYGLHMPKIKEIQDWVLQCSQAPLGLDLVVKGAIPTIVKFSAVIYTASGETLDMTTLQNKVASHVNRLPFNGLLAISTLTTLLHQNLPAGSFVTKPVLLSMTYLPSGEIVNWQATDRLDINFGGYATNRTTLFFCDPADVSFEQRYLDSGQVC